MYFATLGIDVVCVKPVRKMYGLPCCVTLAPAAAVKLGISPRRVSAWLTMIEPENTGPKTANTPSSTALAASPLATPGLVCVSAVVYSIWRPRIPPAALTSLIPSSTPFLNMVPAVAPEPDSSTILAILMGGLACAQAGAKPTPRAASAQTVNRCRIEGFMKSPCELKGWSLRPPCPG